MDVMLANLVSIQLKMVDVIHYPKKMYKKKKKMEKNSNFPNGTKKKVFFLLSDFSWKKKFDEELYKTVGVCYTSKGKCKAMLSDS